MTPGKTTPSSLRHQTKLENTNGILYMERYTYEFDKNNIPEWYEKKRPEYLFDYHYHEFFEIIIVHSGKMRIVADFGKLTLRQGDILLINRNEVHAGFLYEPGMNVDYTFMLINLSLMSGLSNLPVKNVFRKLMMGTTKAKNHITAKTAGYEDLMKTFGYVEERYMREEQDPSFLMQIGGAMDIFSDMVHHNIIHATKSNTRLKDKDFSIHVLNYIQSNYTDKITTRTASSFFAYDESQFCRLFKKNFSVGFTEFLNSYRIKMACCYNINDKSMTIDDIAKSVGYDNYSYFCRNFKKYAGKSPKEFFSGTVGD